MTATFTRRCGACRQVHICQSVIRECFCAWCGSDQQIETVRTTPDIDRPAWFARLWHEAQSWGVRP